MILQFHEGSMPEWAKPEPAQPTAVSLIILTLSTGGLIHPNSIPTSLLLMIKNEISLKGYLVNTIRKPLTLPKILFCRVNHILLMYIMTYKVSSCTLTPLFVLITNTSTLLAVYGSSLHFPLCSGSYYSGMITEARSQIFIISMVKHINSRQTYGMNSKFLSVFRKSHLKSLV